MNIAEKKPVGILFTGSPFSDFRVSETLRMAVGLTLGKNSVRVFFGGDGTYSLLKNDSERLEMQPITKHIETLNMLKCQIFVEEEALAKRNIDHEKVFPYIQPLSKNQFHQQLSDCEILINS